MSKTPAYINIADQIRTEYLSGGDPAEGDKLPTQEALAKQFRVSRSTVVRALSKLMAEGSIHSMQGSGAFITTLAPAQTDIRYLSLIVPSLHSPVVVSACRGVERRARQSGYQVLLASSEGDIKLERELVEQHLNARVKGFLLYPATRRSRELENDYLSHWSHAAPVVTIDIGCEEWPCSRVHFDNYRLGYDMTRQLLRHGHSRIAFMHTAPDNLHTSIHDRRKGWATAMEEAGIDIPESYDGWPLPVRDFSPRQMTDGDHRAIVASIRRLEPLPDAIIAWNDVAAAHIIQAMIGQGIRVPEEIRVVGFDCEPLLSRLFHPEFPTSRPDFARLGELAVDALEGMLTGAWTYPRVYYYPVPVLWREPKAGMSPEPHDPTE